MHDCLGMESKLVDLVFDALEADERLRLLAELETCTTCLSEYRSMTGALSVFDQSVEVSAPDESHWPVQRAALRRSLDTVDTLAGARQAPPSLWKRIFAARLPVPVPLAAAIALALLATSALALRPTRPEVIHAPQPAAIVTAAPPAAVTAAGQDRIVEVPVYRERVVMRTVYVEKRVRERRDERRQPSITPRMNESVATGGAERESVQGGFFTRANLTDFQPTGEMTIRVIRRSNTDEN